MCTQELSSKHPCKAKKTKRQKFSKNGLKTLVLRVTDENRMYKNYVKCEEITKMFAVIKYRHVLVQTS